MQKHLFECPRLILIQNRKGLINGKQSCLIGYRDQYIHNLPVQYSHLMPRQCGGQGICQSKLIQKFFGISVCFGAVEKGLPLPVHPQSDVLRQIQLRDHLGYRFKLVYSKGICIKSIRKVDGGILKPDPPTIRSCLPGYDL